MNPGDIYRLEAFYQDPEGKLLSKYLVVLALDGGGDLIGRLLTSRAHGRPENPRCYHGDPYAGFYLGILGAPLTERTWVDLRGLDDFDCDFFAAEIKRGRFQRVLAITPAMTKAVIECVASADDTTGRQERNLRNQAARM